MFRVKIALIAASTVAIVTILCLVFVSRLLAGATIQNVEATVDHAQEELHRSTRLDALELTTAVAELAREDELAQIFTKADEAERRSAAHVACDARQVRLEKRYGRKAAIVAVTDKNGKVVARDLNPNSNFGDDFKARYPSLGIALAGTANKDIWNYDGQMYRVGAAPIRSAAGQVVGALIVGFVQSTADAREAKERLGTEVAYFLDGKIHASSFQRGEEQSSESAEEKALAAQLFEGPHLADKVIGARQGTETFHVKIGGVEYVGAAAPLPGNVTKSRSGFVVLSSLTAARAGETPILMALLVLGLIGVLTTLGAAVATARRFLGPLDKIEAGLTEVINGNHDYKFESPSPDFEGLAEQLNVMVARLLGRPDPSEEGEEGESVSLYVDEPTTGEAAGAEAAELAREPSDAYYQRIWREYAAARRDTGEDLEGMNAEQFVSKLKEKETILCRKYNARMVRFKVVVRDNETTLKPVPIS